MDLHSNHVPEDWKSLAAELGSRRGPFSVYVMGAPDRGKTTLIEYLGCELAEKFDGIRHVDLDPGQGSIGPPSTLGAAFVRNGKIQTQRHRFVGSVSPPGSLLQYAAAAAALKRWAKGVTVIDSCGFTEGDLAVEFQYNLIELLRPEVVVRLGTDEGLRRSCAGLEYLPRMEMRELSAPVRADTKSPEIRAERRNRRFRECFRGARTEHIDLGEVGLHGKVPERMDETNLSGLLLALCDRQQWTMAIGMGRGLTQDGRLSLLVRDYPRKKLASIQFGSMYLPAMLQSETEYD